MLYAVGIGIRDALNEKGDYLPLEDGGGKGLGIFFGSLFTVAIVGAVIFVFFSLISAGYTWLSAGGDTKKIQGAQEKIKNGLMGLAIVAAALAIGTIVAQFYGAPLEFTSGGG